MQFIPFFIKPVKVSELVDIVAIEQNPIAPNSNPFHYDLESSGTQVAKDILMMTSGSLNDQITHRVICVNPVSGQRFSLVRVPRNPVYYEYFNFGEFEVGEPFLVTLSLTKENSLDVEYTTPNAPDRREITPAGSFISPKYFFFKGNAVLASLLERGTLEEVAAGLDNSYCEQPKETAAAALLAYKEYLTKNQTNT